MILEQLRYGLGSVDRPESVKYQYQKALKLLEQIRKDYMLYVGKPKLCLHSGGYMEVVQVVQIGSLAEHEDMISLAVFYDFTVEFITTMSDVIEIIHELESGVNI